MERRLGVSRCHDAFLFGVASQKRCLHNCQGYIFFVYSNGPHVWDMVSNGGISRNKEQTADELTWHLFGESYSP